MRFRSRHVSTSHTNIFVVVGDLESKITYEITTFHSHLLFGVHFVWRVRKVMVGSSAIMTHDRCAEMLLSW